MWFMSQPGKTALANNRTMTAFILIAQAFTVESLSLRGVPHEPSDFVFIPVLYDTCLFNRAKCAADSAKAHINSGYRVRAVLNLG